MAAKLYAASNVEGCEFIRRVSHDIAAKPMNFHVFVRAGMYCNAAYTEAS